MGLIVILTNDGTGTDESANYRWQVRVNARTLFSGRTTGHNRKNGVWGLLAQLAIEQLGIAGAELHSTKGEPTLGSAGKMAIACLLETPPDSAPGAIPGGPRRPRPHVRTSLIEQGVFNYPPGMEGWRNYRIEYGGHAEYCLREGIIWLPPHADPMAVERFLQRIQKGGTGPLTSLPDAAE